MGLFKKKEAVPTIPTSPSLPPLPSIKEAPIKRDLPGLPSFPTSSKNENLNQEMVKSAVADAPSLEASDDKFKAPEPIVVEKPKEESKPVMQSSIPEPPKSITPSAPESVKPQAPVASPVPTHLPDAPTKGPKPNEPIFVRIDKFQSAQKNFNEIKSKVIEMEEVINKIKEVKSQEEEELKGWTEDVEKLKVRLSEIDGDIFSQL